MTMINSANFSVFGNKTARLASMPRFIALKDNALKVFITAMYETDEAKPRTRSISLERYIPANADGSANTNSVYMYLVTGSPVSGTYEHYNDPYTKDGKTVYATVNEIKSINLLESRAQLAARRAALEAKGKPSVAEIPGVGAVTVNDDEAPIAESGAPALQEDPAI